MHGLGGAGIMRVLHVYRTYFPDPPGGLQEAIRQIALSSQPFGVDARIFALSPKPEPSVVERVEGVVVRARSWAAPASCDLGSKKAFTLFRDHAEQSDVVHYHFPWPFGDVLQLFSNPRRPAVMTYHSDVVRKGVLGYFYQPLMRCMLRRMEAVVATSNAYIDSSPVLGRLVQPHRLHVIPLGITEQSYRGFMKEAAGIEVESRFGVAPGRYMLFVGVLRPYKGLDTLIEAAAGTNIPVLIVGSGRVERRLRTSAAAHGNVRFVGQVGDSEKIALIQGCRALVLPSHLRSEAFGMVLVEAAMCGKPMISCDIGTGTSFVNLHEKTGFVVPPNSPGDLAWAMRALLENNELAERMGKAARERYEQLFSGEALGRAYAELYREVAGA